MLEAERLLAFRLARTGLVSRDARTPAEAVACPASDFHRDAALLAVAARAEDVTRESFDAAVERGELAVAHVIRGAIHAVDPADQALFGPALVASDDEELLAQLGEQVKREARAHGFAPSDALGEVTAAVRVALAGGRRLDKNALHEELRGRLREELLPWCKGCGSHHAAPMLWRFAVRQAPARLDADRRYLLAESGGALPPPGEAVRRFLRFYGPSTPAAFGEWAGMAPKHAKRVWNEVAGELSEADGAWLLTEDEGALASPPQARGVRLVPPGDPFLQKPNRPLLVSDEALRKRLFRPVASPGAVLRDGRLAGLWRAKAKGRRLEVAVEPLERLPRGELEDEAQRVARLRGAELALAVGRD